LEKLGTSQARHRYVFYYALEPWTKVQDEGIHIVRLSQANLRKFLQVGTYEGELPPLPSPSFGEALVDVADREALYEAMEGPEFWKRYR